MLSAEAGPASLGTLAERNATVLPDGDAVVDGARRLTWAQVDERTARMADALRTVAGGAAGDRIAFVGENCLEAYELFHACARAGMPFVPLNERLAPGELNAIMHSVEPTLIVHTPSFEPLARRLAESRAVALIDTESGYPDLMSQGAVTPAADPDPVSSICFTSGTTGRPKGVLMTHVAQLEFARVQTRIEETDQRGRHLFVRPMSVAPGHRMIAWHGLYQGTTVIRSRFEPADFFAAVEAEQITNVLVAPTMLRMLLDNGNPHGHDLSSLQCMTYGGAPMSVQLLREVLAFFACSLVQGYGGSEAGQVLYLSPQDHRDGRIETNGRRVPGVEVQLRTGDGRPVGPARSASCTRAAGN